MKISFTLFVIPPNRAHIEQTGFKQLVFCKLKLQLDETNALIIDKKEVNFITVSFKQLYFSFLKFALHETDCLKQVSSVCGPSM